MVSENHRNNAMKIEKGEWIALESKDDPHNFPFWLARSETVPWQHQGKGKRVDGIRLRQDGWYVNVRYLSRWPVSSNCRFEFIDPEEDSDEFM